MQPIEHHSDLSTSQRQLSDNNPPIKIGISACLAGQDVRYNGGRSSSRLDLNQLQQWFEFQPFCPELAAGFGVPRPVMRLIGNPNQPRLVLSDAPEQDYTERLLQAAEPMLATAAKLDGYVLMKNSPSCGLERVKVYQSNGYPHAQPGRGLFTQALLSRYPQLPIEEEGRLRDARLRENFFLRVIAHHRFRQTVGTQPKLAQLMNFQRDYKYVLMAHNQREYRALGRLLAQANPKGDLQALRDEYFERFMRAIAKPASRANHSNVLLHLLGYLKHSVPAAARRKIADVIARYRRGEVYLATPLTLLDHYLQQFGSDYIKRQQYLTPYPAALGLTNQL